MMVLTVLLFSLSYIFCRDLQVFSNPVTNATRFVENRTIVEGDIIGEHSTSPGSYAVGFGQISQNLIDAPGTPTPATSGNLLQIQNIQASKVISESIANSNYAENYFDIAVSGNNQSIANVEDSILSLTGVTSNNTAYSTVLSTAGNNLNIGDVTNSTFRTTQRAQNNLAYSAEQDAIAGNQQILGDLEDSTVYKDFRAENNSALAGLGNAVAGNQVVFGDISNTDVDLNVAAFYNYAVSDYGDAVSGTRLVATGLVNNLELSSRETNFGNTAQAPNGNAIIGFQITTAGRKLMKYIYGD